MAKQPAEIDVTEFGLRYPPDLPPVNSGEAAFDKAIAGVEKKAASHAKRGVYEEVALPARLKTRKPGDLERVLAILTPQAFDMGESTFDMGRGGDKAYLAAWRACIVRREPRQGYIAALVRYALQDEAGEAHVQPLLVEGMKTPSFAKMLIDTILTSPRPVAPETLRIATLALDNEGVTREMYNSWHAAARAAVRLGPEFVVERLFPLLTTEHAKAVGDVLNALQDLDASWHAHLIPVVRGPYFPMAAWLLARTPATPEVLDALAGFLQGQIDTFGQVYATNVHDYLVTNADSGALAGFPPAIAASVAAARG